MAAPEESSDSRLWLRRSARGHEYATKSWRRTYSIEVCWLDCYSLLSLAGEVEALRSPETGIEEFEEEDTEDDVRRHAEE